MPTLQHLRAALRGRVVFLAGNRQALASGVHFVRRDLNRTDVGAMRHDHAACTFIAGQRLAAEVIRHPGARLPKAQIPTL